MKEKLRNQVWSLLESQELGDGIRIKLVLYLFITFTYSFKPHMSFFHLSLIYFPFCPISCFTLLFP